MRSLNQKWIYKWMFLLLGLGIVLAGASKQPRARPESVAAQAGDEGEDAMWTAQGVSQNAPQNAAALAKISPAVWSAMAEGQTDFLVVLAAQADLSAAKALPTKEAKGRFVYHTLQALAQRTQAPLRAMLDAQGVAYRAFYIINALQVSGGQDQVLAMANRPEVARIVANPRVQISLPSPPHRDTSPSRAPSGIEWNISKVGAPQVWSMGYTGQDIVVAGQDTGYDWDHPALQSQYRGWDGAAASHNYNWHDAVHSDGGSCGPDAPAPCDDHGHGTHTMGTMVGDDGADRKIGVAPGARWIGCRNMNHGIGTPTMYIECFEFFLAPYALGDTPANGRPDMAPDVIGNSWSCPPGEGCDWDTLQAIVETVRAAGIMVVAAAGNSGPYCSTVRDPIGLYDASYTIGATDSSDRIASFSGRGPVTIDGSRRLKPDIVAPGVSVFSSLRGGSYGLNSGTSMATPHIVGGAALLWSARPELRGHISQTEQILNATTLPLYSTQCGDEAAQIPNNVYGWGRLDALAAVQYAVGGGLRGQVMATGGPVEGALIRAQLTEALSWRSLSEPGGAYTLSLVTGTYTVTASASGYLPYGTTGITVAQGHTTTLDIMLEPCVPVQDVDIAVAPAMPHLNDVITFTASVTGGTRPVTYTWALTSDVYKYGPTVTTTYKTRGIYPVTLTVANCGGSVTTTQHITIVAPEIAVTGSKLKALLRKGETAARTVTITNVGDYPLSWGFIVTPTVDWLTLEVTTPLGTVTTSEIASPPLASSLDLLSFQTGGQGIYPVRSLPPTSDATIPSIIMPLAPQRNATLSATFDAQGLTPGDYTSTLIITSTDIMRPYIALPVTLAVRCEPINGLSIHHMPTGDIWAGETLTFTAKVLTGTPPITYRWTLAPDIEAQGPAVTTTYKTRGIYPVGLTATNCGGSITLTQRVTVVAPEIAVMGSKLEVIVREGESTSRVLTVTNVGSAPLSWGAIVTPTVDWLHLKVGALAEAAVPSSSSRTCGQGICPVRNLLATTETDLTSIIMPLAPQQSATLSVTFNARGLTPGGYTSTLVITSTDTTRPYIERQVFLGVDCEPVDGLSVYRMPPGDIWAGKRVTFTAKALTGTLPITYTWGFGDGGCASGESVSHTYPITASTRVYSLTLAATNPCQIPKRSDYPIMVRARTLYLPCIMRTP